MMDIPKKIENVVVIDTETTGLDPAEPDSVCIEVACVRYSIEYSSIIDVFSSIIEYKHNAAEHINKIPNEILKFGGTSDYVWGEVQDIASMTDATLAHYADFDKMWVPKDMMPNFPIWIDTCNDVDWPQSKNRGASLISICLEHGVAVVDPHRALNDCLLLCRLMTRVSELGWDLERNLLRSLRPSAMFSAEVSFDNNHLAKNLKFKWNPEKKLWLKKMFLEETVDLPFKVRKI